MIRKSTFFTSDWHIGHKNVLELSNRPFKDLDQMHKTLIRNYNSCVSEDSVCYFLGDMGLCSGDIIRDVVSQLNGTKVLILGNHDNGINSMYNKGFDVVLHGATLEIAKEKVTLSHCPLEGVFREDVTDMRNTNADENWHGELRYNSFTTKDNGQFHLHGHLHAPNKGINELKLGRQWDIGVDGNNYRPVSISQVEKWITSTLLIENI